MGLDHIKELLSGRRSLRLVLVVSDLVSDLEVLVVSAVGLIGPNLRLGWMVFLNGVSPKRSCTSVHRWTFAACRSPRLGPFSNVFLS